MKREIIRAIDLLEKIVDKKLKITEALLNSIHSIVLKNIEKDYASRYHREQVRVLGADLISPNYLKLPELMNDFIEWLRMNPGKLNIVEFAAMAHYKLARTHPYVDGNGRVARLLMNIVLMREGYPPAIILNNNRKNISLL